MGVQKAQNTSVDLSYDKLKVKKNWKMKVIGCGGKIDKANAEIKAACGDNKTNKSGAKDAVSSANIGAESADQSEYQMIDGEDQADVAQADADAGQVQADAGQSIVDESPTIESMQAATNEKIAAMTEGLSGQQEQVMTQLQEKMTIISEAGEQIAANAEEVEALQAELAEITADSAEGGEFSTGMAAAGGQNSAYSLSVPTGPAKAPKAGQAKKGGLISSGAQQTPQAQGAQQGQQAQGGQSADAAKTARAQEIYARLVEINEQNCTIQDTITTASEEAMVLQTEVTELMETQTTEVTEDQTNANDGNAESMETLAKFQEISTVGTIVNVAGGVIKGVGKGIAATGLTMDKTGGSVGNLGKFLKGMFGGVKVTGTSVSAIFPIFTAAPGGTVAAAGTAGQGTAQGVVVTGKGIQKVGGALKKSGEVVGKVGQGVKVAGQGIQTVGAAGTVVCGIQQGNWSAIIGGAVGFLGAAASFVGNAGQFAQALGAAKDGFFGACAQVQTKIGELLGNAGSLSSLASKGTQMGNTALQNGTGGFQDMVVNAATTFIPEAGALKSNNTAPTTGNTTGTTSTTKEESSEPTVQVETKISTPAMRNKAKNAGLTDEQIKGKSDLEIQKMIEEKNATNKPKVK